MDGKTRINGEVYCKILVFAKKEMDKLGVTYLMEDGSRAHSCYKACEKRVDLGIEVFMKRFGGCPGSFFWPGNSPDMNPIENAFN